MQNEKEVGKTSASKEVKREGMKSELNKSDSYRLKELKRLVLACSLASNTIGIHSEAYIAGTMYKKARLRAVAEKRSY